MKASQATQRITLRIRPELLDRLSESATGDVTPHIRRILAESVSDDPDEIEKLQSVKPIGRPKLPINNR